MLLAVAKKGHPTTRLRHQSARELATPTSHANLASSILTGLTIAILNRGSSTAFRHPTSGIIRFLPTLI